MAQSEEAEEEVRRGFLSFNPELMTSFTDTLTNRCWRDIYHRHAHFKLYALPHRPFICLTSSQPPVYGAGNNRGN